MKKVVKITGRDTTRGRILTVDGVDKYIVKENPVEKRSFSLYDLFEIVDKGHGITLTKVVKKGFTWQNEAIKAAIAREV